MNIFHRQGDDGCDVARQKPFLQIKCWDQRRALAFPGKSFMAKASQGWRGHIFIVVANSFTRCLLNSPALARAPGKTSLCGNICCYLGENTHTTDNKAQGTLEAKGASKGSTAAATRKFVQAPHEGDWSTMNGKRFGWTQQENWSREKLFSVSVASWMFHIETRF